jgi:hypothetical protein
MIPPPLLVLWGTDPVDILEIGDLAAGGCTTCPLGCE